MYFNQTNFRVDLIGEVKKNRISQAINLMSFRKLKFANSFKFEYCNKKLKTKDFVMVQFSWGFNLANFAQIKPHKTFRAKISPINVWCYTGIFRKKYLQKLKRLIFCHDGISRVRRPKGSKLGHKVKGENNSHRKSSCHTFWFF